MILLAIICIIGTSGLAILLTMNECKAPTVRIILALKVLGIDLIFCSVLVAFQIFSNWAQIQ
jgi:hypothetical protein